ncbi:hypothetical protein SAMN02745724_03910 [Pseudoalteromonas denitrificans DSM 6059]|jgi:hypothetical protein|uniref:Uncharacterized protein n=1 Tax=Pseudoalteromonas denitrificans DSM 6059 TaxID=1123010 RepID=A0A1I1QIN7_9GAMM|nr:hypothetical protein SAMN02745724_03910 [Pseudoalteromonas denitrificans DSM 6059]
MTGLNKKWFGLAICLHQAAYLEIDMILDFNSEVMNDKSINS